MSCLTRKLQQHLTRYIRRHSELVEAAPENVRDELVNRGLCPSQITTDQVRLMLKTVRG